MKDKKDSKQQSIPQQAVSSALFFWLISLIQAPPMAVSDAQPAPRSTPASPSPLTNDLDIIHFYKHAPSLPALLPALDALTIKDATVALICFGLLEAAILAELRLEPVDEELKMIRNCCGASKTESLGASLEKSSAEALLSGGERVKKAFTAASVKDGDDEPLFYCMNLSKLIKPLIYACGKQAVDLIFLVFWKAEVNHFEVLFEHFKDEADLLAEVHLAAARAMKARPFSFGAFDEVLGKVPAEAPCLPCQAVSESCGASAAPSIEVGGIEVERESATPSPPVFSALPSSHIQAAKALLLRLPAITSPSGMESLSTTKFCLEALSTLLALSDDHSLWPLLLRFASAPDFESVLTKFVYAPFILFRFAKIEKLLCSHHRLTSQQESLFCKDYAHHTRVLTPASDISTPNNTASPTRPPLLHRNPLPCNPYTLKAFLDYATKKARNTEQRPFIARGLPVFLRKYKEPSFFHIFDALINGGTEIYAELLKDLPLYFSVFYSPLQESDGPNKKGKANQSDSSTRYESPPLSSTASEEAETQPANSEDLQSLSKLKKPEENNSALEKAGEEEKRGDPPVCAVELLSEREKLKKSRETAVSEEVAHESTEAARPSIKSSIIVFEPADKSILSAAHNPAEDSLYLMKDLEVLDSSKPFSRGGEESLKGAEEGVARGEAVVGEGEGVGEDGRGVCVERCCPWGFLAPVGDADEWGSAFFKDALRGFVAVKGGAVKAEEAESLLRALRSPSLLMEDERVATEMVIESFKAAHGDSSDTEVAERNGRLEQFILYVAGRPGMARELLPELGKFSALPKRVKSAVVAALLGASAADWRLRKLILLNARIINEWGGNAEEFRVQCLQDRVFLIRELAKSLAC